ncbi:hypothetical protein [Moraxella veridica]|uniref:hypothetical protein n=1 Tax=Moraxella veridica TaxID=3344666 RepID=UPI0028690954|nr:hypothetical protein [Moraxella catarrhalis]
MLPDEDGIAICQRCGRNSGIPIIMLTAKAPIRSYPGLEAGADDYLQSLTQRAACAHRR